jgi:hypothetical protein
VVSPRPAVRLSPKATIFGKLLSEEGAAGDEEAALEGAFVTLCEPLSPHAKINVTKTNSNPGK